MYTCFLNLELAVNSSRAAFKLSTLLGIKNIGYLTIFSLLSSVMMVIVRLILLFL